MQLTKCKAVTSWGFFTTNLSTILVMERVSNMLLIVGFQKISIPFCLFVFFLGGGLPPLPPNPSLWFLKASYPTEFLLTFFGVGMFSRTTHSQKVMLLLKVHEMWKYLSQVLKECLRIFMLVYLFCIILTENGTVPKNRPLPIIYSTYCLFRPSYNIILWLCYM